MATAVSMFGDGEKAAGDQPASDGYRPSPDEPFMNERQLAYFRGKLLSWKEDILEEAKGTLAQLQTNSLREADITDRASSETDWSSNCVRVTASAS